MKVGFALEQKLQNAYNICFEVWGVQNQIKLLGPEAEVGYDYGKIYACEENYQNWLS